MGLKDIFKSCTMCNRSGLFAKLDSNGYCPECAEKAKVIEEKRKREEEKRILETSPSYLLNKYTRYNIPRPCMYHGASRAYAYFVNISNVDRDFAYQLVQNELFDVTMEISDDGRIALISKETIVGYLADKTEIATDWIRKNLPYICQLAEFKEGKERVALYLFRHDEGKYSQCNVTIAKLTSFASEEKQYNISVLEPGERLIAVEDDNGKWYVADLNYHELGRLPAKFSKMLDDDTLRAIFFDHAEMSENANGDEIEIPYVRFYYD